MSGAGRDPLRGSIVVSIGLVMAGVVAMWLAWSKAAGLAFVPFQLPWILVGGLGGVGLIGIGLAVVTIQLSRRAASVRTTMLTGFVEDAGKLLGAVNQRSTR